VPAGAAATVRPVRGLGTLVNVVTVVVGTGIGLALGPRLPERVRTTVLSGLGLITFGVGVSSFLETRNAVFPVVAIVLGGLVGELVRIEERLEGLGERIRSRAEGPRADLLPHPPSIAERDPEELRLTPTDGAPPSTFVDGFVTASLTFCVGALVIVGSLQDGISGNAQLLLVKASLDGLAAVVFASVFGWGVGFSALSILVLQGALTLVGATVGDALLSDRMVVELEATGGPMIIGIALRLLDLKKVAVGSFLPGLVIAPVLVALFAR
jgi:uncharacterized membrane protein YqgA involved in biofilm formation